MILSVEEDLVEKKDNINTIKSAKSIDELSFYIPISLIIAYLPLNLMASYITTSSTSHPSIINLIIMNDAISLERALFVLKILDPTKFHLQETFTGILNIKLSDRNKTLFELLFQLNHINKDKLIDSCIDNKKTRSSLIQWLIYDQKAFPVKTSNIRYYFVLRSATPKQILESLTPADAKITSRILKCYFKKSKSKKATPLQYLSTCPEWQKPHVLKLM
jgi:hypothetical protein